MLETLTKYLPWRSGDPLPLREKPDWAWTPDQAILEQYYEQLLFVPDDMKEGGKHHDLLQDICWGGPKNPSVYTHNKFLAFRRDLGDYSTALVMPSDYKPEGFFMNQEPPTPARVQGELYSVQANRIYLLDKHKQNGVQFARQRVKITYPWRYVSYGKVHPIPKISSHSFITIVAWMYVALPRYWDPMIGGVFAKPLPLMEHDTPRPWIGEFYKFEPKQVG